MNNIAVTGIHEAISFESMQREVFLVLSNLSTGRNMLLQVEDDTVVELMSLVSEDVEQEAPKEKTAEVAGGNPPPTDGQGLSGGFDPSFEF